MIFFILALAYFAYEEVKTYRRLRGYPSIRLLGPAEPTPKCRACLKELPDPLDREMMGHGAYACDPCWKEIQLEVGLTKPDWFDGPCPPEPEKAQGSLTCLKCGKVPAACVCDIQKKLNALCDNVNAQNAKKVDSEPILSAGYGGGGGGGGFVHTAIVDWDELERQRKSAEGWAIKYLNEDDERPKEIWRSRASGELYAPSPRKNCPVTNCKDPECTQSVPSAQVSPLALRLCLDCGYDHSPNWPCLD
jgi:hypothetical protein